MNEQLIENMLTIRKNKSLPGIKPTYRGKQSRETEQDEALAPSLGPLDPAVLEARLILGLPKVIVSRIQNSIFFTVLF